MVTSTRRLPYAFAMLRDDMIRCCLPAAYTLLLRFCAAAADAAAAYAVDAFFLRVYAITHAD